MFLKGKKGDIVLMQIILIIIAVIMIFVVSSFGAKIWSTFFPNDDKSSVKSFSALYYIINAEAVSPLDYEMSPIGIYLKKGYYIAFFDGPTLKCSRTETYVMGTTTSSTTTSTLEYHMPSTCIPGKQCLCLYSDSPELKESKKDKSVIECDSINNKFNIDPTYFDLNNNLCTGSNMDYQGYLIIKTVNNTKPYVYVLKDTDDNRKESATWSVPVCTNDASSLCYGKKDGSVVTLNDDAGLKSIYNTCIKDPAKYKSTSVQCTYVADKRTCRVNCSYGDVTAKCGTDYGSCEDFNQLDGIAKYISKDTDYQYYYMCNNDKDYCNHGCQVYPWEVYIIKDAGSSDGSAMYNTLDPETQKNCNLKYIDDIEGKYGRFLSSYNTSNPSCVDAINKVFYPDTRRMLACKSDALSCENFVTAKRTDCSIKYLSDGDKIWITYYDLTCDAEVKGLFSEAYFCASSP